MNTIYPTLPDARTTDRTDLVLILGQGALRRADGAAVLAAARSLSNDSNRLQREVGRFLETVRAA